MSFVFNPPEVEQETADEIVAKNSPRTLAPKGPYNVRLFSISGKEYTRKADGKAGQQLAELFFVNLDGNYEGATLSLFRVGENPASTTNLESVMAIAMAAGVSGEESKTANWAINTGIELPYGKVAAAIGTPASGELKIADTIDENGKSLRDGVTLMAYIDIAEKPSGKKYNVVKNLKLIS